MDKTRIIAASVGAIIGAGVNYARGQGLLTGARYFYCAAVGAAGGISAWLSGIDAYYALALGGAATIMAFVGLLIDHGAWHGMGLLHPAAFEGGRTWATKWIPHQKQAMTMWHAMLICWLGMAIIGLYRGCLLALPFIIIGQISGALAMVAASISAWWLAFVLAKNVPMLWGVVISDNKAAEILSGALLFGIVLALA